MLPDRGAGQVQRVRLYICTEPVFRYSKYGCVNWNQYYTKCTTGPTNPFHGAISFDNIGLAWVAIFLVISLEGWTDVMYFVQVGLIFNHVK